MTIDGATARAPILYGVARRAPAALLPQRDL